jgi:Protein of unknown function (DUF1631)
MPSAVHSPALAAQARRFYFELLLRELPRVIKAVNHGSRELMSQAGSPEQVTRRRDLVLDLPRQAPRWHQSMVQALRAAVTPPPPGTPRTHAMHMATKASELALVDDDTIELEIVASRMALAIMDKASWEFSDLRYRMSALERRDEMDAHDVLRPHVLARSAVDGWRAGGMTLDHWRTAQQVLHEEFAALIQEGYHETNRWLIGQNVCTDVNLRPFIRRSRDMGSNTGGAPLTQPGGHGPASHAPGHPLGHPPSAPPPPAGPPAAAPGTPGGIGGAPSQRYPTPTGVSKDKHKPTPENAHQFAPTVVAGLPPGARHAGPTTQGAGPTTSGGDLGRDVQDETRLMTRSPGLLRRFEQAG